MREDARERASMLQEIDLATAVEMVWKRADLPVAAAETHLPRSLPGAGAGLAGGRAHFLLSGVGAYFA